MKRKIKNAVLIMTFALAVSALCACGSEDDVVTADMLGEDYSDVAEDYETEVSDIEEVESEPAADVSDADFGDYNDKVSELISEGLADQFILVNIDEDDSPELVASDSTGSYDHENAFIFTVSNGEVVELASVIAGIDGANLDYAEGKNLIHVSGAAAGMRDIFSKISDGKLEEVFVAEETSMDEDGSYSVNGSSVEEAEYYKQINDFVSSYNPMKRIAYDGLYEINYRYSDGYGGFETGDVENY